ncbi:hypothetical protein L0U85_09660 [Glycomyces sp. L485]|uniref:hypothetical protein n=1 Tax=Glycomyces sp. L485 TaxID=2909235 RepID=UPI001F4B8230|nr:hypothetical protein [Glycomyces sp. L485]MCH7231117.1 hypothetical protein [Glycomyces sp. L485]
MSKEYDLEAIYSVAKDVCPDLVEFYEDQLQAIETAGAVRESAFTDEFLDTWNGMYLLLRDATYETVINLRGFGPALVAVCEAIEEQEDITVTEMAETENELESSNFGTLFDQTSETMADNAAPDGYVDAETRYDERADELQVTANATEYDDLTYSDGDEFRGVEPSDPAYETEQTGEVRQEEYDSDDIRDEQGRQHIEGGSDPV